MVYRVYVEKRKELAQDAESLKNDLVGLLGVKSVTSVRIINRYDVEGVEKSMFDEAKKTIFAEPQLDETSETVDFGGAAAFAVEPLPGQFDQRADSAAQCFQLAFQIDKPLVSTAKIYVIGGNPSSTELEKIKAYVINPVECREASFDLPKTLHIKYDVPTSVETLNGFLKLNADGLAAFVKKYGLAMDESDIAFCQAYFKSELREPTITEIRMIDTYWSDHCRHTTFLTTLDEVTFDDPEQENVYKEYLADKEFLGRGKKPVNLMDVATLIPRLFKKQGKLPRLDVSEEINACTVKIKVTVDGKQQDWLLLFKNETHNHPTEIEPFGGAATCLGGAIRDPLSGRAYVYAAMRITGAGNPLTPVEKTVKGKLPQRKIVTTAAAGYSSYGNQIGLATGIVDEVYHPGYVAKRLEIGAVIGAAPEENVRRECPLPGDIVILIGGRTGRDGCGGATGSSKAHNAESLSTCGAEVQKGNAPEERKLQRLFRNKAASLLIKRCNDFGAGGVSVAVGELADGLEINLNAVPKKYDGLDGTELAISESQERMAVVVAKEDVEKFKSYAAAENLEATVIAEVKAEPRLKMMWNGKVIVDVSREFLNSNGAEKHTCVHIKSGKEKPSENISLAAAAKKAADDLNFCSKKGLSSRFDSTIGAGTVLMPFGGKYQVTPIQTMVNKISTESGETDDCSFMSWGFDPYLSECDPYKGAYLAVLESLCKLVAAGAYGGDTYLTLQEFFPKPKESPERWGLPLSALLGAYKAQKDYSVAAIGGKDSMSGSFENIDVPPTLVSFAVSTGKTADVCSPEFKKVGSSVYTIKPAYMKNGLPEPQSLKDVFATVKKLIASGDALSVYSVGRGGLGTAVYKMCAGNGIGFKQTADNIYGESDLYGTFVIESAKQIDGEKIGETISEAEIIAADGKVSLDSIEKIYDGKLESVYPTLPENGASGKIPTVRYTAKTVHSSVSIAKPKFLIPVFPGTNCEYDSAKAIERAGGAAEIFVVKNLSPEDVEASVKEFAKKIAYSQAVFIPGGFSGGDEPDGSAKFITSFFRNSAVKDAVHELIKQRGGLMAGVCNGFQALIKLGLLTYGEIRDAASDDPTLTFNTIGRHQSAIVRTAVASNMSPWLSLNEVGKIVNVPISHGEGRFLADEKWLEKLKKNGQIATQYVDLEGAPTYDVRFNPNGSAWAVEGITSPDGRVLGKMGHSERISGGLYRNVPGDYNIKLFDGAVEYFK